MRFYEFKKDGSTLAVRTINRYADEVGADSMDYDMFKKSAELLDKEMLKSLAQHIENSDTAPREYVMKTIANHDPDTFKKMYGDQEGYLSVMKPMKNLTDAEDNTDRGMNKYGLAARHKDGKFHSYRHGKHTGSFDSAEELAKHQQGLIKDESIEEGASMMPYFKDPKDEKQMTWTFPDAWSKDEPLDTPYMSNASMRQFLDTLGYNADFEDNQPPVPAKEFIARTTQWLQKNIDKPSAYEPTTVDRSGGGATMYSGGRDEGHMNNVIKGHNELARKIVAKYPEVTHFGFN